MLAKQIEYYMGRIVDFSSEAILQDDGDGPYIREWNITEKPKPDLAKIENDFDLTDYENTILSQKEKSISERIDVLENKVTILETK